jgi:hypothetical protein
MDRSVKDLRLCRAQCGKASAFPGKMINDLKGEAAPRPNQAEAYLSDFSKVSAGKAEPYRTVRRRSRKSFAYFTVLLSVFCCGCNQGARRSGMPAGAQAALDAAIEDIDAGRYEKLYNEAADEWRHEKTLDESKASFQRLRDKLGNVRTRNLQSAREEQTSTAPVRGHSLFVVYQTTFERGEGMETFTFLEHGGSWYLARHFVSSSQLK